MKLVFVENNRPVTDSLMVAEQFSKRHDRVMQDIRELGCSDEFRLHHFVESTYINQQGRETPKFIMTQQGFVMLAMGYTGQKAMRFKEQYIAEFDRMQKALESKVEILSERKALIQSLKLTAELAEEVEEIKVIAQSQSQKLVEIEAKIDEQITLDSGDQRTVQKAVARRVYELESDPTMRSNMFRQLHREIKDRWAVASYRDVRRNELGGLISYINAWRPVAA